MTGTEVPLDGVETRLEQVLPPSNLEPVHLHRAMRHAVLSGGKRLRPRVLLAVFEACQAGPREGERDLALQAACAIELVHAASLVQDDLPIFDDAPERRGRPTVHVLFGAPLAVLTGDALLVRAFEIMADAPEHLAARSLHIVRLIGWHAGSRQGIIGGQSMEEPCAPAGAECSDEPVAAPPPAMTARLLDRYHQMKTGALFQLAAEAGATAAGVAHTSGWAEVGLRVGLAYQLADDLYDVLGSRESARKPVGQDERRRRPNAVRIGGAEATRARLGALLGAARQAAAAMAANPAPMAALFDELEGHITGMTT